MKQNIIKNLFTYFLFTSVAFSYAQRESKREKPNILYIMSDDHTSQAIGAYGGRLARLNPTPTIDRLAKEGILLGNAFVTNSICTPSRASIMTGQFGQVNGVVDLSGRLAFENQYLPIEIKKQGYETAMIGKWHLKYASEAFDYYNVLPGQGDYHNPTLYRNEGGEKKEIRFEEDLVREVNATTYDGHSSDVITDISLDWLKKNAISQNPFC